jgi:hypothetical protein
MKVMQTRIHHAVGELVDIPVCAPCAVANFTAAQN